jgi:hypothetical protein
MFWSLKTSNIYAYAYMAKKQASIDGQEESWFQRAARIVVRQEVPLRHACSELKIDVTSSEAEAIYKSEAFQKVLQVERMRFAKELANTPGRDKQSAIGLLYLLVQKLIEEKQWEKAVNALEKLMKAEGWTGQEGNINVFAGLSAKEYAELMKEVENTDERETGTGEGTSKTSLQ